MSSQLGNLKRTIDELSKDAQRTGNNLSTFKNTFNKSIGTVSSTIGGSAQRKDQEVIASFQEAAKAVEQAVAALEQAAKIGSQYGQSL